MIGEALSIFELFKSAVDSAKTISDMSDKSARKEAVSGLHTQIMAMFEKYQVLASLNDQLTKENADLKSWISEKSRYQLEELPPGAFAYRIKPESRGSEPDHRICADCYNQGKKALLHIKSAGNGLTRWRCGGCNSEFSTGHFVPPRTERYDPLDF